MRITLWINAVEIWILRRKSRLQPGLVWFMFRNFLLNPSRERTTATAILIDRKWIASLRVLQI
jgi:hypothetical protein